MSRRVLRRVAIGALVLLGLGASGLVCQRVGERGRYVASFSTYGGGPEGTRGLYLLADALGANPVRWAEDLGRLPERGMLVALGSCDQLLRRSVGRIERENLRAWIERGGVLVVAGVPDYLAKDSLGVALRGDSELCRPTRGLIGMLARAERKAQSESAEDEGDEPKLEDLPGSLTSDPAGTYRQLTEEDEPGEARLAAPVGPPLAGIRPVAMQRALRIELDEGVEGDVWLALDGPNGRPAGVRVPVGEGAVIALASASFLTNAELARGGGVLFARLVRELAPEGPILFDEYHLGVGQQRSMMRYFRQIGAGALIVQLLLLVGVILWRGGARFGALRAEPPAEPGGTASYVGSVAELYRQSRDEAGAAKVLIRRALGRIAEHHHLASRDPGRMIELFTERGLHETAEAVRALERLASEGTRLGLARSSEKVDELVARATEEGASGLDIRVPRR